LLLTQNQSECLLALHQKIAPKMKQQIAIKI